MPVPQQYKISDLTSFEDVTKEPRQVAAIAFYRVLDCLIDLAYAISHDFFALPHLYVNIKGTAQLSQSVVQNIVRLHAQYGTDENFLNFHQRCAIYAPILGSFAKFGDEEGHGDFPHLSNELIEACAAFSERVFDTGVPMLRERVRTAHRPLKEYLIGFLGDSLRWSAEEALRSLAGNCYDIYRNAGVAARFGVNTPAIREWPYREHSQADILVDRAFTEASVMRYGDMDDYSLSRVATMPITRGEFEARQRLALRMAEFLASVIDYEETDPDVPDQDNLITAGYKAYAAALRIGSSAVVSPMVSQLAMALERVESGTKGFESATPARLARVPAPRNRPLQILPEGKGSGMRIK